MADQGPASGNTTGDISVDLAVSSSAVANARGDAFSGGSTTFGNSGGGDPSFLGFGSIPGGDTGKTVIIVAVVAVLAYLVYRGMK